MIWTKIQNKSEMHCNIILPLPRPRLCRVGLLRQTGKNIFFQHFIHMAKQEEQSLGH